MDDRIVLEMLKSADLRYGENPHQAAAIYDVGDRGPVNLIQGKELSFTNLLDLDAAERIIGDFDEPAAVIVKHTNPCGAATSKNQLAVAYRRARQADPLSAFGGIVGLNREINAATARLIVETFIECVIAPGISAEAKEILTTKPQMRVVEGQGHVRGLELRSALGRVLVEDSDEVEDDFEQANQWRVVTKRQPTDREWDAMRFAWMICAAVKANAVIFTTPNQTKAIGCGQMSRVDSVEVARMRARMRKVRLRGTVAASDAFFPFRDGLDAVAAAGARAVIQPGGSRNDAEVIVAADEHGMAMVFTGRRHFRH